MVTQHYRWDFIGLSTYEKPTPGTSEKVVDGSTYYCADNSKLYVYCTDNWYERKPLGGGGGGGSYTAGTGIDITNDTISVDTETIQEKLTAGSGIDIINNTISATGGAGPTVVQSTGNSETDVMSQMAVTSMVFHDPTINRQILIGAKYSSGTNSIAIGYNASAQKTDTIAIGESATPNANNAVAIGHDAVVNNNKNYGVALGAGAYVSRTGEVNVGTGVSNNGYNTTNYRVIGGVHDGQDLHDAATVAQGNTLATSAPDTSTVGVLGQLWTDTTNMHTYQCTAISGSSYTWTQRW